MSIDECTDKFVDILQYVGQEYDMGKEKAKRYTQRLHFRHSSLILAIETHSFHSIVDVARKIEVGAIIEGCLELKNTGKFSHLTKTVSSFRTKKDKGGKFGKKRKKKKFWNRIKSGLGMGGKSSLGLYTSGCVRCGKPHRGVYRFGTSQYYRCGQKGHMSRECPNMERVASQ
ncbi:hypothetical protein P3X46_032212 [Hevea brasiliensis]|uniref:CCHC-type domain-containing protein n=1 Tax=Hevea brasiliensis TaxID=3981 RepID=A0ABQ9KCL0_HEVBR|nr:hypothetical protein P3X46_032212 [Hevea brasiliensis]